MTAVVALHNEELKYVSVNSWVGLVSGLTVGPSNIIIQAHTSVRSHVLSHSVGPVEVTALPSFKLKACLPLVMRNP